MLKFVAIALLVIIGGVLLLASTRPDTFRVSRSTRIKAPPDRIFPLINDLRAFNTWSPFEKKDPAMKRTFSGAPTGKGSVYEFDGNSQIGTGRLEITDSVDPSRVAFKLDMLKPMEGHNVIEFTLQPEGEATLVTWSMHGPLSLLPKVMGLFINMDRMVGNDFEAGLAALKSTAEQKYLS